MPRKTLSEIATERPYPDFADWWPMRADFLRFMSNAIVDGWRNVYGNPQPLTVVEGLVAEYLSTVYGREMSGDLVASFAAGRDLASIRSGEFDALSYAFYRAAYTWIESHAGAANLDAAAEKRRFAERVGASFYRQLHEHLRLDLPDSLRDDADFAQMHTAVDTVGRFLKEQGYLRDHFAFRFDVDVRHADRQITQSAAAALTDLRTRGVVYALYEMGYPVILPSAVYLYHSMGEAQHHSSRTIQELFLRMGYAASETADFDPTGYPSDMVVELWEIRPRSAE
ncbi:MAG: hypothetical protein R2873_16520 [Caldilineaceae bacterium]